MKLSELIKPGAKVDVLPLSRGEKRELDGERSYKSQVLDYAKNGNCIMSMPMDGSKLELIPLHIRYRFVFYVGKVMYRAEGQAVNRYKADNRFMMEIELKTQLERFQRREFYRFPCLLEFTYFGLTEEDMGLENGKAIFVKFQQNGNMKEREHMGRMVDLSGGGAKIRVQEKLERHDHLLLWLHLKSTTINQQFFLVGSVIECIRQEQESDPEYRYEARVRFLFQDDKTQEQIVRYIFEEERRTRSTGSR